MNRRIHYLGGDDDDRNHLTSISQGLGSVSSYLCKRKGTLFSILCREG